MTRLLVLILALAAAPALVACKRDGGTTSEGTKTYSTAGTIKSFGDNKSYVNIQHDDIPGYMKSMTMSFEPSSPDQLASLKEGDRVTFTFSDADGKRVLKDIKK